MGLPSTYQILGCSHYRVSRCRADRVCAKLRHKIKIIERETAAFVRHESSGVRSKAAAVWSYLVE